MAKIKFNEASVPATLTEGAFVVVDGVTYVGNSDNEPILAKGYKEYVGSITQSGTNDPTEFFSIIEEISITNLQRFGVGIYTITVSESIDYEKAFISINNGGSSGNLYFFISVGAPTNAINLRTKDDNGDLADGIISNANVNIRVYY